MKTKALYFFRTLGVMVVMPLVFIVLYPFVYLMLPEMAERLADLPRDLALFIVGEVILVPLGGIWFYFRSLRNVSEKRVQEASDTRDVL